MGGNYASQKQREGYVNEGASRLHQALAGRISDRIRAWKSMTCESTISIQPCEKE